MTTLPDWLATQTDDSDLIAAVIAMAASGVEIGALLRVASLTGQTGLAGPPMCRARRRRRST